MVLVWGLASAVVVTYFFFSAFFPEFSPIDPGDAAFAFLVIPGFCGFVMGAMLSEFEEKISIYGSFILTAMAVGLIFVILFLPLITGTVEEMSQLGSSDQERQAVVFSSIFILPVSLIGSVAGKAFGEAYLPSEEDKVARRLLIKDTKKWHEMLQSYIHEKVKKDREDVEDPDKKPKKED
jgi:hypothetical protein